MKQLSLLSLLFFIFVGISVAQVAQGPATGSVGGGVTVTTDSFEAIDGPAGNGPVVRIGPNKLPIPRTPIPANAPAPTGPAGSNYFEDPSVHADSPMSPPPITVGDFVGIPQTNSIPPDPHLAVGPNHIIQVVNTTFRISDKAGNTLKTINASSWFASAFGGNPGAFDPKVQYDHFAGRWIMVWLHQSNTAATGAFLVSVSDDDNPLGTWYNWSLPNNVYGSTNNNGWTDYEGVGFDRQAIYITGNQFLFSGSGQGPRLRIIPKAQLYANNAGPVSWTDFWSLRDANGNSVWGVRPSVVHSSPNEYYLVGKPNFSGGTYFAVFRIANVLTSPAISVVNVPVTAWSEAPPANQLGGGSLAIETGGSGILNEPTYRDSSLWVAHCVAANGGYSAIRYVRIRTVTNTAVEDVAFGAVGFWHYYAALVVDKDKNLGITFSRSGDTEYIGAYFSWRLNTDTPGLRPAETISPGSGNYVKDFGGGRNRWGDYMGAALDPADKNNTWFLTEYASSANTWSVWIHGARFVPYIGARVTSNVATRDFGRREATTASDTMEIKINNIGSTDLVLSSITKSQASYNLLNLPSFPKTLTQFDSLKFKVYFKPSTQGTVNDTIRLTSNDANTPTYKIPLTGKGVVIGRATAGVLYAASGTPATSSLSAINTATGAATTLGATGLTEIHGLTIHPTTRELYGVATFTTSIDIYRISSAFGDALPVRTVPLGNARAVTFAGNGQLYAGTSQGRLYRINISTGDTTYVGTASGIVYSGLAFNPITGKLWASVRPPIANRDKIFIINTTDGSATEVGSSGGNNITPYLAFDARGKLYGLKGTSTQIDTLIAIDTTTAFGTRIGSTGFSGINALAMRTDSVGTTSVREIVSGIPQEFTLDQNYPNPFNPTTVIRFSIPAGTRHGVTLQVFDVLGQEVATLVNENLNAGSYQTTFSAEGLASGVYFYCLTSGGQSLTKKLLLTK